MKKISFFAMLLAAALGLSGCDLLNKAVQQKEPAKSRQRIHRHSQSSRLR